MGSVPTQNMISALADPLHAFAVIVKVLYINRRDLVLECDLPIIQP